ncbi:transcriptional Coactivator p15-domain-containing protein [Emericellopsis atlantica]|uniref:Transcriptional Coactivator p15-domain-containing protein n=1 Tax=Emericellopsis atlantica TaxID=2614577 RepID=A0A9P7ZFQ0_9HYPO|nr:transcriptional Coactivator p15-domain-containing protein [Emericellopsis atlantica]KAG9251273.1 transcriptional Coactivator p15-domain-containing protein [Emericellopsis atlantica]
MAPSRKRGADSIEDPEVSVNSPPAGKKSKSAAAAAQPAGKDDDGHPYWDLSGKRRAGVSEFKNTNFVNIREYYEKDGKHLPGKKGISLSVEQYTALLKAIPGINAALRERGHTIKEDAEMDDAPVVAAPAKSKSAKDKANIDATSDEDSS